MSRLTQQLATVSKSLMRISEQLTELAVQLDKSGPSTVVHEKPKKATRSKK